jgi:hypothetical protein
MIAGDNHGKQIAFVPAVTKRECSWCDRGLIWNPEKHCWTHPGGQPYIMECSDGKGGPGCGWEGEAPSDVITIENDICPGCGVVGSLRDNHVAMPGKAKA